MSSRLFVRWLLSAIVLLSVTACSDVSPSAEFADTFDQGLKEDWRPYKNNDISGDWIVDRGRARVSGLGELSHQDQVCGLMLLGNETWNHYAVEMDVALAPDLVGGLFVWIGVDPQGPSPDLYNYISLKYDGNQYRADYPARSNSQKVLEAAPRHIRIEVRDKQLVLLVNRATVYDYHLLKSLAGALGLMSCTPAGASAQVTSIDNFQVFWLTP